MVPRTQRSVEHLRNGALQSRGPGYFRLEETGVPVLRSGMKNAASRPGHGTHPVIAGLDPAIHPLRKTLAKMMDTRVKPAYGAEYVATAFSNSDS